MTSHCSPGWYFHNKTFHIAFISITILWILKCLVKNCGPHSLYLLFNYLFTFSMSFSKGHTSRSLPSHKFKTNARFNKINVWGCSKGNNAWNKTTTLISFHFHSLPLPWVLGAISWECGAQLTRLLALVFFICSVITMTSKTNGSLD